MESKVAAIAPAPDPASPQFQTAPTPAPSEPEAPQGPDPVDVRLVIEVDQASGSFIYKTIDRRTGEVVLQLPRAEVLKMREGPQYEAGSVIRTKV